MRLTALAEGLLVALAVAACGPSGADDDVHGICLCDSPPGDVQTPCDPLAQTGCQANEKCSWIIDATVPMYVGHTGCVPDGSQVVGASCMFGAAGATGYDDCVKGTVCSSYTQPGVNGTCQQTCDLSGSATACGASSTCARHDPLFTTGVHSPPSAGVCEVACDPLADNDFDGPGSALSRTGNACGTDPMIGCYGIPSNGEGAPTAFSCTAEQHYGGSLRHRTECTFATGCAGIDGTVAFNACSQGYLAVLRESNAISTVICVAMCAPLDCYAGHCGSNDASALGAAPHRCTSPDAVGNFGSDEECQYLWAHEVDGSGNLVPSPWSDSVGFCVDHAAYGLPPCKDLPLHGSGSALGAADLGCVSSQTVGLSFTGKPRAPLRTLYHRVMR